MGCIDKLNYEILYKGGYKECAEYIRKNFKNINNVFTVFGCKPLLTNSLANNCASLNLKSVIIM